MAMIHITSAVAALQETLRADCRSDFAAGGGAAEDADPVHCLRSGSPGQHSQVSFLRQLLPGAVVQRVSFEYAYNTGFGPNGTGANFSVLWTNFSVLRIHFSLPGTNFSL